MTIAKEWKQQDTDPYDVVLSDDSAQQNWNITGWTFVFSMMTTNASKTVIKRAPVSIVDATKRIVRFTPTAAQTNITPGTYYGEWEGTDASGIVRTFPTDGYDEILIKAQIA